MLCDFSVKFTDTTENVLTVQLHGEFFYLVMHQSWQRNAYLLIKVSNFLN